MANLYAPFYRQANLTPNAPVYVAGIPTTDAIAAFDYYIKHYNHGRPFMLAGHSQGANTLSYLLSEYVKTNLALFARMIAAYVIGFPVTAEYLSNNPHLKFAEGPGDTGVIISYNTQAPYVPPGLQSGFMGDDRHGHQSPHLDQNRDPGHHEPGLWVILAGYERRLCARAAVCRCQDGYHPRSIDLQYGRYEFLGRLNSLAGFGVYHIFDYPFYYFNLSPTPQRGCNTSCKKSAPITMPTARPILPCTIPPAVCLPFFCPAAAMPRPR